MAANPPDSEAVDPRWTNFRECYDQHPAVLQDCLYALPSGLIDALLFRIPQLLTAEEWQFERDLSDVSGSGFFLQRPFTHPLLTRHSSPSLDKRERAVQERQQSGQAKLQEAFATEMLQFGRSRLAIDNHFERQQDIAQRIEKRCRGYAGWLVTHPEFQRMRGAFCHRWGREVRQRGALPAIPFSLMGLPPEPISKPDRLYYEEYMKFYRHWSLERLVTWDLPVPMQPELVTRSVYALNSVSDSGLQLFIPWYLLADHSIKVHELADHHRSYGHLKQLEEWLSAEPDQLGNERFGQMFDLYVYLELALRARYGERLTRKAAKLDLAFADFTVAAPSGSNKAEARLETIRKVRHEMGRRLRKCEIPSDPPTSDWQV